MKFSARLAFIFPLLLTLAVFWQVTQFDFVDYDDGLYIYNSPSIQQGLTLPGIRWAFCADLCFDSPNADYWQPVTMISRMLDMNFWGLDPHGHHLSNLALHLANVLLLYFIFLILSDGNFGLATWIAAAFAIHPAQGDVVPWVTARKDVLSIFFGFLTILAYLRYTKKTTWPRYFVMLPLYACSLMSKPILITMPVLLLILDYWPLERWKSEHGKNLTDDWKRIWLRLVFEKWAFFGLAAASILITFFAQSQIAKMGVLYYPEAPISVFKYILDFLFPGNFSMNEPFPEKPVGNLAFIAWLPLVFLTYFLLRLGRTQSFVSTGWLWFLTALLPVMPLRHEMRFLPIAAIGLLILTTWSFIWFCRYRKIPKTWQCIAALSLLCFWAVGCFLHSQHWRNSLQLGEYAARVQPQNVSAHETLAVALWDKGKDEEAIDHFTKAIWLAPEYDLAHANLAELLHQQGKLGVAEFHFKRALEINPGNAELQNNYGVLLADKGDDEKAIKHFQKAVELNPGLAGARINLSRFLLKTGKAAEALNEYTKASGSSLWNDAAEADFGSLLNQNGMFAEAIEHFTRALQKNSKNAEAHNNMGVALWNLARPDEAAGYFQEAIRINPRYAEPHNNLAILLTAEKKWDEAAAYFQKAIALNPDYEVAKKNLEKLNEDKKRFTI